MTASSIFGGFIRSLANAELGENYPIDTALARDAIVQSAIHLCDEAGQVRAAWSAPSTAHALERVPDAASTWYRITRIGAWPITLRRPESDGELAAYKLRVRMAGYSSGGHQVDFRIVLAPWGNTYAEMLAAGPNTASANTTSGTSAWLAAGTTLLELDGPRIIAALRAVDTLTAVSGDHETAEWAWVALDLWAKSNNVASTPKCTGYYAAEYVG